MTTEAFFNRPTLRITDANGDEWEIECERAWLKASNFTPFNFTRFRLELELSGDVQLRRVTVSSLADLAADPQRAYGPSGRLAPSAPALPAPYTEVDEGPQ